MSNTSNDFSEIFGSHDREETVEVADNTSIETGGEDLTSPPVIFEPCGQIDLWEEDMELGLSLVTVFPDSNVIIIKEHCLGVYYLADLDMEILYPVGMVSYTVNLITQEGIVISFVDCKDKNHVVFYSQGEVTIVRNTEPLTPNPEMPYTLELKTVDGIIELNSLSTQIHSLSKEMDYELPDGQTIKALYLAYPSGCFTLVPDLALHYSDREGKITFTLAVAEVGCFFGYSMFVNESNETNIENKNNSKMNYEVLHRMSITTLALLKIETGEIYLLGVRTHTKLLLSDVCDATLEELEVLNGVPLLIKAGLTHKEITVFTPEVQHIALRKNNHKAIDSKLFGNGIYINKERVLLLDNGTVAIATRDKAVPILFNIRGGKVKTPVKHLGKINELSNSSVEEET